MELVTDPTNPEAALTPIRRDGRPSLSWLQFAIEELTPFKVKHGNGTRSLFIKLAKQMGYKRPAIASYLGGMISDRNLDGGSKNVVENSKSPIILEADAVIEKMILE